MEPPDGGVNFNSVLTEYFNNLESMNKSLKDRDEVEMKSDSEKIIEISDDILAACHVYMDFVHPVWIEVDRIGDFNPENIEQLKTRLNEKLEQNQRKLHREFLKLTSHRQTEE
jgi:hypothetical protein